MYSVRSDLCIILRLGTIGPSSLSACIISAIKLHLVTPLVISIVCAVEINIFGGGKILFRAEDIHRQKTYIFTWYIFHLLLNPMATLRAWFLRWIYAASAFSLQLFLGHFLQFFQQPLDPKLYLGDIMCYLFLNYYCQVISWMKWLIYLKKKKDARRFQPTGSSQCIQKSQHFLFMYFTPTCLSFLNKQLLNIKEALKTPLQTFLEWLLASGY